VGCALRGLGSGPTHCVKPQLCARTITAPTQRRSTYASCCSDVSSARRSGGVVEEAVPERALRGGRPSVGNASRIQRPREQANFERPIHAVFPSPHRTFSSIYSTEKIARWLRLAIAKVVGDNRAELCLWKSLSGGHRRNHRSRDPRPDRERCPEGIRRPLCCVAHFRGSTPEPRLSVSIPGVA
jgi:hypothetical protein